MHSVLNKKPSGEAQHTIIRPENLEESRHQPGLLARYQSPDSLRNESQNEPAVDRMQQPAREIHEGPIDGNVGASCIRPVHIARRDIVQVDGDATQVGRLSLVLHQRESFEGLEEREAELTKSIQESPRANVSDRHWFPTFLMQIHNVSQRAEGSVAPCCLFHCKSLPFQTFSSDG